MTTNFVKTSKNSLRFLDELLKIAAELAEIEKRTGKKEADVTT